VEFSLQVRIRREVVMARLQQMGTDSLRGCSTDESESAWVRVISLNTEMAIP